ncbi:hypothetical protein, partial [Vannielia litorea]|uniref:hypothetical protein n=1 Tax=Vannielia litorea TaxID=1217970 RepID=UPI001BCFD2DB
MNRQQLARNLATSLTLGAWTEDELRQVLTRRLPPPLHRLAPAIASRLLQALPWRYAPSPREVARELLQLPEFNRIHRFLSLIPI